MRVGVNTGEVVVRSIRKDDLHTDYVPGGALHQLGRAHGAAGGARLDSGHRVHPETDRRLFCVQSLGPDADQRGGRAAHCLRSAGRGTAAHAAASRGHERGLTRFVGRQSELEQLRRALEQAKAGHGQIVGVMGEPGLGKSRLFYEFKLTLHEWLSRARSLLRLAWQSLAVSAGDRTAQELLSDPTPG